MNIEKLAGRVTARGRSARGRRRAARRLADMACPEAVEALARAAVASADEEVAAIAHRAFAALTDQAMIDAVCQVWSETRDTALGTLIGEAEWLASRPAELRALTALHTERVDELASAEPSLVRALTDVVDDERASSRDRVIAALSALHSQEARDTVCELAIEGGSPAAMEAAVAGRYLPADPAHRAFLLFLTGQFDRYEQLDFDGALLRAAYTKAHERARARLPDGARESGRTEWVRAVITTRQRATGLHELTATEWEAAFDTLIVAGQWGELWRLSTQAPPVWGARMLRELSRRRWLPPDESERAGYAGLSARAKACPAEIPPGTVFDPGELLPVQSFVGWVTVSADGRLLAWADGMDSEKALLWHLPSGESAGLLDDFPGGISSLALDPYGEYLAVGGEKGWLDLRRVRSGSLVFRERPDSTETDLGDVDLAMNQDGRMLASAKFLSSQVRLWHLPSGTPAATIESPVAVVSLAMAADGSVLATAHEDQTVRLWRPESGRSAGTIDTGCERPELAINADGSMLAADDTFGKVLLYRLPTGQPVDYDGRIGHEILIGLAGTVDAGLLVCGSYLDDGQVRLYRLPSGEYAGMISSKPDGGGAYDGAITPDGSVLAVDDAGQGVRLWRSALAAIIRTPVGQIDPAEIERIRKADGEQPAVRAWLDLAAALVLWRRRHDIELDDRPAPSATDVELREG